MKNIWRWLLPGAVVYLVFLVVAAPADKLLPLVQPQLQGVRLSGVEGRLWSGQAMQVSVASVQLSDVRWSFRPLALLLGRAEFSVSGQLQGQAVQGRAGSTVLGRVYLSDVQGRLAASDLLLYWQQLKQVSADGYLDFSLDEVRLSETGVPAVAGTVNWSPARVVAPIELQLGKVQLETRIEDEVTRGKLEATDGTLLVQGDVELNASGAYSLNADLQQKGNVPQAVAKFLSTFAEYNNGSYRLEWSDTL
jgi:general secretion pathway protein N